MSVLQVIVGSDLTLTQDLTSLRGFGTSLASGVDVDENSFNGMHGQKILSLKDRHIMGPLQGFIQKLWLGGGGERDQVHAGGGGGGGSSACWGGGGGGGGGSL